MDSEVWFLFGLGLGTLFGASVYRLIKMKQEGSKLQIGNKVYAPYEDIDGWKNDELTVTEVGIRTVFCSGYVPPEDDLSITLPTNELGKTWFVRKENAEKVIQERNNNE